VTSRDTTASGFCSEVGLSPRSIDEVIVVIRTFPIRVGGPSGPFEREMSWDEVRRLSNAPATISEYTSVTKKLRRVAKFDLGAVQTACRYNQPTSLAVMGIDRLDYANTGVTDFDKLTDSARTFLEELHQATHVRIEYAGTGFGTLDVVQVPVGALNEQHAHV
jgi:adenylosuccinate synthase